MKLTLLTLFLTVLTVHATWAQKALTGLVIDESGEPVIGASIIIEGSSIGTITDYNGNFTINLTTGNEQIIVSFIGFKSQIISAEGNTSISVTLKENVEELSEVVVVGYGTQEKKNLTGAIENISLDDVENRAITNAGQILQGKVSGVQIIQSSGQPGQDDTNIRIRGVSSISNNNEPLIIIDGIIGSLEDVHPNDIESMTVLKDASAAAIYGAQASAGVVLIKTKVQKGELRVSYKTTFSLQQPTALPDVVDAATYAEKFNEARENTGFPADFYSDEDIELFKSGTDPRYPDTNWYDIFFPGSAFMQNHYISMGAGQENYDFNLSAGYLDQQGVLVGTSSDKLTYRAKLNTRFLDDKLRINTILSGYDRTDNELSSSTPSILAATSLRRPTSIYRAQDSLGNPGLYGIGAQHIAFMENGGGITRERDNVRYQLEIQAEPIQDLIASLAHSKSISEMEYTRLVPSVNLASNVFDDIGGLSRSQLSTINSSNETTQTTLTLRYNRTIGKHFVSGLVGGERLKQSLEQMNAEIYDLSANQPVFALGDPSTYFITGSARTRAIQSVFSRINYIYNNKYLFEVNIRRDGSSRFTNGSKYGTFPSLSAGWRVSEESFFNFKSITNFKVRASWGLLGNEYIGSFYPQFSKLSPNQNYSFGGTIVPGTAITELAANNVTWETVEQVNLGFDITYKGRLDILLNFFSKRTYDNLITITVPKSLGVNDDPYQNVGEMKNEGVELSLEYRSSPKRKFKYTANFNMALIDNSVTSLGAVDFINHTDFVSGYQPDPTTIRSQVGETFASYYGYIAEGIYQVEDFYWQNESDPTVPHEDRVYVIKDDVPDPSGLFNKPAPGDIRFKDLDGNGIIDVDDKSIIGNSQPRLTYSFGLSAKYKNFDFSFLAQGVGKQDAYVTGALVSPFWGGSGNINQDLADNRWTFENESTTHQRLHVDSQRSAVVSSYYIQDAAYLRIKNIQIGYKVPKKVIDPLNISYVRAFVSVENAFTFTNLKGFDPERSFNKITADFHPQIVIYSTGLQVRF